jgi:hypothetical protein
MVSPVSKIQILIHHAHELLYGLEMAGISIFRAIGVNHKWLMKKAKGKSKS